MGRLSPSENVMYAFEQTKTNVQRPIVDTSMIEEKQYKNDLKRGIKRSRDDACRLLMSNSLKRMTFGKQY